MSQSLDVCLGYSNNINNNKNTGTITENSEAKYHGKRFAVAAPSSKHCTEQRNRNVSVPVFSIQCSHISHDSPVSSFGRQHTHSLSVIKTSQLILYRGIIAVLRSTQITLIHCVGRT